MKLHVCAVFDTAVGVYTQPVYFRSKGEAIRSFIDAVKDEKSQFSRHAKDYAFVWLGEWDDNTGFFESPMQPHTLLTALEAVSREE